MGRTLAPLLLGLGGGVVGAGLGLLLAGGELLVFLFLLLFLDLVVAAGALPKLPDAAAEAPSQLGDALRPEEQEDDDQRDDQLRSAKRTKAHRVPPNEPTFGYRSTLYALRWPRGSLLRSPGSTLTLEQGRDPLLDSRRLLALGIEFQVAVP